MKLLRCNGRILTVRDVGDVIRYELHAGDVPLRPCGWFILDDDVARARCELLRDSGLYERKI